MTHQQSDLEVIKGLREHLSYNKATGILFWKKSPSRGVKIGDPVLCKSSCGYVVIRFRRKCYQASRVIWAMTHGVFPDGQIDHINGVRSDNRLSNLRDVSAGENRKNMKIRSDNKSGFTGVYWFAATSKWLASIRVDGKSKHLGLFNDIEDAIGARAIAEIEHGFHPNHGRAA